MQLDPETDLSFTRTLPIPPALVWTCWTSAEHIPHFFVPKPHRVVDCDIDLRVGGRFNTTFEIEGNRMENEGVYLEIVPERRLVFTDAYTEGWKPSEDPFMTAILDLTATADGGTVYTATARHRTAEKAKAHQEMGFQQGWNTVADQLVEYAQGLIR